jgi:2-polyprenyl-6-methoxyphenol hydroxylase-like FAD-dependent oxidoreductase
MYDVIITGARCGGASTAMLLARKGYRVLLLDRAPFPSEIPHGHFIHNEGPRLLKKWGLLDAVVRTNCPPLTRHLFDFGDYPMLAKDMVMDGVACGYAPRRKLLDQILVEAAVEAGAEFRDRYLVEAVLWHGSQVCGVAGRDTKTGRPTQEHATIVIGADGRNSPIAHWVQAPMYDECPTLTCWYWSFWADLAVDEVELYIRDHRVLLAMATNDGLTNVAISWPVNMFPQVRANVEKQFYSALEYVPALAERVRAGRRVERFYGTADLPNFFRRPYGPGWALVGDAGCHKDPMTALGMSDAFRDADLLATAINLGLSGETPLQTAFADYEQQRNSAGMPSYHENLRFARFSPVHPEVLNLRAAIRGNAEASRQMTMARNGMIPREDFFSAQNIGGLLARAGAANPGS